MLHCLPTIFSLLNDTLVVDCLNLFAAGSRLQLIHFLPLRLMILGNPTFHQPACNRHTKIGSQTRSKTAPEERNLLDPKVPSRQHAEVWKAARSVIIAFPSHLFFAYLLHRSSLSLNGTFINGEMVCSEGHKAEPFELKSDINLLIIMFLS